MFFESFPKISYNNNTLVDITRRIDIPDTIKSRADIFYQYIVKDGEKPEDIAYDAYGDPNRHWIILLMNNVIDPFYDWVMNSKELERYVISQYPGSGNAVDSPDGIHHYLINGVISQTNVVGSVSISNRQFMDDENEKMRTIKMIRKEYIGQIEAEMAATIS